MRRLKKVKKENRNLEPDFMTFEENLSIYQLLERFQDFFNAFLDALYALFPVELQGEDVEEDIENLMQSIQKLSEFIDKYIDYCVLQKAHDDDEYALDYMRFRLLQVLSKIYISLNEIRCEKKRTMEQKSRVKEDFENYEHFAKITLPLISQIIRYTAFLISIRDRETLQKTNKLLEKALMYFIHPVHYDEGGNIDEITENFYRLKEALKELQSAVRAKLLVIEKDLERIKKRRRW